MKYLDLFAGYGGFSLGIQQAYDENFALQQELRQQKVEGQENNSDLSFKRYCWNSEAESGQSRPICIGFSEVNKYAIQTYLKHFPQHKNYGDITQIDPTTIPDFDLLCGGFPCQAFSIAGKRAGFEDTRGTLIYDVFRIIEEKHPKLVLLENVKGLLSHDSGRTFKTIITSLAELGYAVEWQVLNAKNFGVPQNRERVFIIGHLGGFGGRAIFPIGEESCSTTIEYKGNCNPSGRGQSGVVVETSGLFPTIGAGGGNPNRKRDIGYSSGSIFLNSKIRRLTPTECERLMGLPDGWTEGVSDTQRYKLCGNGVVVNVVKEIIKRLPLN